MALGPSALGAWAPGSGAWAVGSPGPGCHSCVSRRLLARWLLARLLARWQAGLLNRLACWLLISMAPWLVGSWLVGSLARRPLGSSALSFCPFGSWLLVTPARALRRVSAPFPYHGNTHSRAKALGWRVRALSHQDDRRTARVKEKPPVCMAVLRRVGSHAR